ncbi:hypothetical protein pb186bvf_000905 [Paramecium bursaria]
MQTIKYKFKKYYSSWSTLIFNLKWRKPFHALFQLQKYEYLSNQSVYSNYQAKSHKYTFMITREKKEALQFSSQIYIQFSNVQMDLMCSICSYDLDIQTRWPRLIPNTGDSICQQCAVQIVDHSIEQEKISHLIPDLQQVLYVVQIKLEQIKGNNLKIDDFPLNQSLVRILQKSRQEKHKDDLDWTTDHSNFLDELHTSSIKKPPNKLKIFSPENDESFTNQCPSHRRPLEVVCLQCQTMICTNCALFGNHRSHNIHSEEDVISLLEIKGQELYDMLEKIHSECTSMQKNVYEQEFGKQMLEKTNKLKEKVQIEFNELKRQIELRERQIIKQIDNIYEDKTQQWRLWWQGNSHKEVECQKWIQQAQSAFDNFTDSNNKYWDLLNQTELLKNKGFQIQQDIKRTLSQIQVQSDRLLAEDISVKFTQIRLDEFCKLTDRMQLSPEQLYSFQCNDDLLRDINDMSATFAAHDSYSSSPFSKTDNIILPKSIRQFRSITPKQNENTDPSSLSPMVKDVSRLSTARKKSNVPIKIQIQLDELKKGKLDVAEFNGIDYDKLFQLLVGEIKQWKVKTFKLLKCKISDEHLSTLFKGVQLNENIIILNLSQNNLTDKAIDQFHQLFTQGLAGNLKNIIVSQNKINARNVKNKVCELKKLGITITL